MQESIQHLYFECPFSAYLWSLCILKLGLTCANIGTLQEEAHMTQTKFKKVKSTILGKVALAALTWHVWNERNERVLQQIEQHKILVFRKLYEDISELLKMCTWKSSRHSDMEIVLSNWNV